MIQTLAAVASLPGRPLARVLRSLRPQVDELAVYLNGYPEVPSYVRELGCHWVRDDINQGSSAKLRWANRWGGYYFACDDDLIYPPDYVGRLLIELQLWDDQAIVTACGRTLRTHPASWYDWVGQASYIAAVPVARWINYLGGCAFAFHVKRGLPTNIIPSNEEEAVLSVWAQRKGVPIRLVQRPYDWPERIPLAPGSFTLYDAARQDGFETRSMIIRSWDPWTVHEPANLTASN